MPLYEYACDACGHRFESIRKFSDPPLTACPKCGGTLRKLMSSPAIQFKGSGWYITDYAKKEGTGAGKPGDASKESGEKSSEKSGEKGDAAKADAPKSDSSKSDSSSSSASDSPASKPAAKD